MPRLVANVQVVLYLSTWAESSAYELFARTLGHPPSGTQTISVGNTLANGIADGLAVVMQAQQPALRIDIFVSKDLSAAVEPGFGAVEINDAIVLARRLARGVISGRAVNRIAVVINAYDEVATTQDSLSRIARDVPSLPFPGDSIELSYQITTRIASGGNRVPFIAIHRWNSATLNVMQIVGANGAVSQKFFVNRYIDISTDPAVPLHAEDRDLLLDALINDATRVEAGGYGAL